MSSANDGIFAPPVEPLFNNEIHSVTSDLLQDWLLSLAKQNKEDIKTCKETQYIFSTGGWCECLFQLCERFQLPWEAKFAALDLLDRFMLKHVEDLFKYVQDSNSKTKNEDWTSILERIRKQAFFRMVTCCQIASKLNSHYTVVTVRKVRRCLLDAGYSYTVESILQSELRVLKTLAYRVTKNSGVDFVEMILETLGRKCPEEKENMKAYHDLAMKILTLVCIGREKIYDRLYMSVAKPEAGHLTSLEQQRKLVAVKSDKMLLAVSVIAVAVHIMNESHSPRILKRLNQITEVPLEDIEDFVKVVLQHIGISSNKRKPQTSRQSTAEVHSMEF